MVFAKKITETVKPVFIYVSNWIISKITDLFHDIYMQHNSNNCKIFMKFVPKLILHQMSLLKQAIAVYLEAAIPDESLLESQLTGQGMWLAGTGRTNFANLDVPLHSEKYRRL